MTILFIGPIRAGKTTLARLLAAALHRDHVSLDDTRWTHYPAAGYDEAKARKLIEQQDFLALARYWHAFDLDNIQKTLAAHPETIVDFGGGHTLFFTPEEAAILRQVLEPHQVVLVLPTSDQGQNSQILRERVNAQGEHPEAIHHLNDLMLDNPLNFELADHVLYTEDQTPEQSVQTLLHGLN
ncbi:AAA family ATPase [Deinococcus roseus]|uniref:Shikimate kinase n=1 Tax=Deinococcus roseus TaxID=392414 RepID=A0ABQ2D0W7_9DEIO|nr:AAA family ATPase [Deinococcus roseus]GGJ33598.1 hypothetical protein GCM10008938_19810 [Deinococcus roseus]